MYSKQLKHVSYHILKQTGDNFLQVKLKGFCLLSENHVRGAATMDTDLSPHIFPVPARQPSCTVIQCMHEVPAGQLHSQSLL